MALRKVGGWEEMDELGPPEFEQDYTPDIEAPEMLPDNPLGEVDPEPKGPDYVPPELKAIPPKPDNRLQEALKADRRRQDSEDLRNLLLAAGRREAPRMRQLGNTESDMVRAVMAQEGKQKPGVVDEELRRARIRMLQSQSSMYDRANQPKPEKPAVVKPDADPERRAVDIDYKKALAEQARAAAAKSNRPTASKGERGGRPLPASMVVELAGFDTAIGAIEDVGRKFNERDMGNLLNKAGRFVRGTDAESFEAEMGIVRQVVGKILEGGKLQAQDEAKYRALMPIVGESPATAAAKVKALADMLRRDKDARINALGGYGFRMPGQPQGAGPVPQVRQLPNGDLEVEE